MRPLNALARALVLLAALVQPTACGDRTVADDTADADTPPKPPDAGVDDDQGAVVCQEGLAACDGACVDLATDDENCGACGHVCQVPNVYGHCVDGACPSTYWCGGIEQGFVTCQEVCASHEQTCDEGPRTPSGGCGGAYRLHYDTLEQCEKGLGIGSGVVATCTAPIDWSIEGGWDHEPPTAVSCCCTQDPPS